MLIDELGRKSLNELKVKRSKKKNKTECSFSFSSIHATRHTPHTCQKSCRKGGADQQGDEDRGQGDRGGDVEG